MRFKDQLNRSISLSKPPSRIISLVPSQTELLVDLGLRDKIVGITHFCVHPKNIRKTATRVGGTKQTRLHKIKKLNPDFILCNKEENTEEMVRELEEIAPVWVTDMYTISDCNDMILKLGGVFKVEEKAREIIDKINAAKEDFIDFMRDKPKTKVLYTIWKNPYMAAGKDTFINELLALNKFENAISGPNARYPEIQFSNYEDLDAILLSTEPYPFKESDAVALRKEINLKVKVVDGEYFSWYGSRLISAFTYFKSLH